VTAVRPPVNSQWHIHDHEGARQRVTVVPTGRHVPLDECNVLTDSGSVFTYPVAALCDCSSAN
jgi:hypothetical protein